MQSTKRVAGRPESGATHQPDDNGPSGEVDYLEVAGQASFTLLADRVSITVAVHAPQLVAEASALDSVDVLAALKRRVEQVGVTDISIEAFEGRSKSGLLGGSTEARYGLRLVCEMPTLAPTLLAIAEDKNATLGDATWHFAEDAGSAQEATTQATLQARAQAEALATALGVTLGRPHRVLRHHWCEDDAGRPVVRSGKILDDLYVRLAARRTMLTKVVLRYRMD